MSPCGRIIRSETEGKGKVKKGAGYIYWGLGRRTIEKWWHMNVAGATRNGIRPTCY